MNKTDRDCAELQNILKEKFPYIATKQWCGIYNKLHPTTIGNLLDSVFLAQSLCRGIPAIGTASTGYKNVSPVNSCVEILFTSSEKSKKVYGVLARSSIINRFTDHKVSDTCSEIHDLVKNTRFDQQEDSKKTKTHKVLKYGSLVEYVRSYRDCLVWYWSFVETYPKKSNDIYGNKMGIGYTRQDVPLIKFNCEKESDKQLLIEYIDRMNKFYDGLVKSSGLRNLIAATKFSTHEGHHKLGQFINDQREKCIFFVIKDEIEVEIPELSNDDSSNECTLSQATTMFHVLIGKHWCDLQSCTKQPSQYTTIAVRQNMEVFMKNGLDAFVDIYMSGIVDSSFLAPDGKLILKYHHALLPTIWFRCKFFGNLFRSVTIWLPTKNENNGKIEFVRYPDDTAKKQIVFKIIMSRNDDSTEYNELDYHNLVYCSLLKDLADDYKRDQLHETLLKCTKYMKAFSTEVKANLLNGVRTTLRSKSHAKEIMKIIRQFVQIANETPAEYPQMMTTLKMTTKS